MDKGLQHKLLNYQALPSGNVWEKINVALDEDVDKTFSERLGNYEQNPPAFIWDNVAASLDKKSGKLIPFIQRFSKPLRYSTAVACLIAVAVLVTLLVNKRSISNDTNFPGVQSSLSVPVKPKQERNSENIVEEKDVNDSRLVSRNQNYNKVAPIRIKRAGTSFKRSNYVVENNSPGFQTDIPERYIIYATSSGDVFRISKKLFDLFACSDVNEKCRENIELMQQQVASSTIMATADFSGLLDLLQNINNP
jgi:hypothetical protein